jgi:hypothetical protein
MHALGPAELLDSWEAGTAQPLWQWANALLRAASPELDVAHTEALTVGQRDRRLLELRETLFGPKLECQANCPSCHATAEMNLQTSDLRESNRTPSESISFTSVPAAPLVEQPSVASDDSAPAFAVAGLNPVSVSAPRYVLHVGDWTMDFRAPNLGDLATAAVVRDSAAFRSQLLSRCVRARRADHRSVDARELPPSAVDQVIAAMSATDPEADLGLDLACPECGHRWTETFDIVAYLWAELDDWAQRTLRDVHVFAMTYGWTESEVLALSPTRRAHYRAMIDV